MRARFALLPAALFLAMTLGITSAGAHATPVRYEPASASVLSEAPTSVQIRFSERIDPAASVIRVIAPDGTDRAASNTVDKENAHIFRADLRAPGTSSGSGSLLRQGFGGQAGTYTVSWQVISADDGHFTKGAYVFSVGQAVSGAANLDSGQFQIQHRSGWPEAITIFLELLGEALLLGALALIVTIGRRMERAGLTGEARALLLRRLRLLLLCAGVLIVTGTGGYLSLKSITLAADQSSSLAVAFPSFLLTVAGRYTLYRLMTGLAVMIILLTGLNGLLRSVTITVREALLWMLLILAAVLRARVSHAAASEFFPVLSVTINAIHLLFKDLWIGGLVALLFAFLPTLKRNGDAHITLRLLLTFPNLLMIALAVGGSTGAYMIWLHLKSPVNLFSTHWGGYMTAVAAFGLTLLVLRLFSQLLIHPSLAMWCAGTANKNDRENARVLQPVLITECIAGLAVLLFSSILVITTPPLSSRQMFQKTIVTPQATITIGEHPWEDDQFLVTVTRTGDTAVGSDETMTVTLENLEQGIETLNAPVEKRFHGGFAFPKNALAAAGKWNIHVSEHAPGQYDAVANAVIMIPNDILHLSDASRSFDVFALMMLMTGMAIVVGAVVLTRRNTRLLRKAERSPGSETVFPEFPHTWLAFPVGLLVVVTIGLALGTHAAHGNAGFAKLCILNGGVWHENVPMRNGMPTSDASVLGCMIGMGRGTFHFADPREFAWFIRRENPHATPTIAPDTIVAGSPVTLAFRITDDQDKPVTGLTFEHDRILHTVIVSQDLKSFAHAHVEDAGPVTEEMLATATFPVRYTFPAAGRYLIGVDYTVRSQTFTQQFFVTVGTPPAMPDAPADDQLVLQPGGEYIEAAFDRTVARLTPATTLKAGTVQRLAYRFTGIDQKPLTDLQPYLAAPMHMSIVKTDLQKFMHVHAELPQDPWDAIFSPRDPNAKHVHQFLPDQFGPDLVAYVLFPTPGQYDIFGEIRRDGKIVLTRFRVRVE